MYGVEQGFQHPVHSNRVTLQDCNHHNPPVTLTEAPLTYDERSDAKKTITSATSKNKQLQQYYLHSKNDNSRNVEQLPQKQLSSKNKSLKELGTDCVKMGKINKYTANAQFSF